MKESSPLITRVHSTTVIVSDQDAALDFYVGKLGWEKRIDQAMGPTMRFLTVAPVGAETEINLGTTAMYGDDAGKAKIENGITFIVEDIDETYATLKDRGVHFTTAPEPMPWGPKGANFDDPDGNQFFIVEE
jgi:catechol 2,3-dioxygenase-like lactoylglutathione lyase family enzyme